MFFKIIFLVIILFLIFIKKNNIEPFTGCIQKYYNHNVDIHMKDNLTIYTGVLVKSDENNIFISLDDELLPPINRNNVKKIKFNNCPNENIYFNDLSDQNKIVYPCDSDFNDMMLKDDYENVNWGSEYYYIPDSYCESKQNYHCNDYLYNNKCEQKSNSIKNQEIIDFCDQSDVTPCEGRKYENYIRYGKVINLEDGYTNPLPKNNCGCIDRNELEATSEEERNQIINRAIEEKLTKKCSSLGSSCKAYSYKFLSFDSQYERLINHNEPIQFTSYYYQNCHLKNHKNFNESDKKTFVKKYENGNNNYTICS